ncbi:hypothetical protein B296_00037081, partial [Ensete ventricosum]
DEKSDPIAWFLVGLSINGNGFLALSCRGKEAFTDLPRSPWPTKPEQDMAPDPNPIYTHTHNSRVAMKHPMFSRFNRKIPVKSWKHGKACVGEKSDAEFAREELAVEAAPTESVPAGHSEELLDSEPLVSFPLFSSWENSELLAGAVGKGTPGLDRVRSSSADDELNNEPGSLKRCNWITQSSGKLLSIQSTYKVKCSCSYRLRIPNCVFYPQMKCMFHSMTSAGVSQFTTTSKHSNLDICESFCGLSAETFDRCDRLQEAFAEFDHILVAKMEEKEIMEISCSKELMLAECRVAKEFGSFSGYIWGHVNRKPTVNRYKYPRSVPLRTPKSEAISKDLVRRGFRLVGPVIVYSFMQAAGIAMDHLVDCFRFGDCVRLAERSWGISNLAM